jgi:pullulanase/glycogen debranching enzyme
MWGFRFDLGAILARESHGFDEGGGFLDSCRQDPTLSSIKLINEPWDCGPGGYQVGRFPPGWAEWNDHYRDTVRRFWRGDEFQLPDLAKRLAMDREHVKGAADKAKGTIKDTAGKVMGDKKMQAEGNFDKAKGEAHNLAGDVKDAARDATKRD